MVLRRTIRRASCSALLGTLLVACVRSAAAQTPTPAPADPVHAGYLRFYGGDPEGAYKHFEALHGREPASLPVWYGLLFTHASRIDLRPALQTSFEQGIDQFLAKAAERYARSHADSEALFYLANGYLLRGRYRLDHDKGIWGAARDASNSKGYSAEYMRLHPEHGDAYLARGLEAIVGSSAKMPPWLKAAATLNLGWTYDIGGRRTDAVKLYKKVVDDYEDQAAAGAARLGLLTPYRPRGV